MARGTRKTFEDKMAALDDKISVKKSKINFLKEEIAELEKQKSDLCKERDQEIMASLVSLMNEKGLSPSDVETLIKSNTTVTEEAEEA